MKNYLQNKNGDFPNFDCNWVSDSGDSYCQVNGKHYLNPQVLFVISKPKTPVILSGNIEGVKLDKTFSSLSYDLSLAGIIKKIEVQHGDEKLFIKKGNLKTETFFKFLFATFNDSAMEVVVGIPFHNRISVMRYTFNEESHFNWFEKLRYLLIPFNVKIEEIFSKKEDD